MGSSVENSNCRCFGFGSHMKKQTGCCFELGHRDGRRQPMKLSSTGSRIRIKQFRKFKQVQKVQKSARPLGHRPRAEPARANKYRGHAASPHPQELN
eukprot:10032121-Heterocapsa_arctica.AAC.1